jgi:hypothetical protein
VRLDNVSLRYGNTVALRALARFSGWVHGRADQPDVGKSSLFSLVSGRPYDQTGRVECWMAVTDVRHRRPSARVASCPRVGQEPLSDPVDSKIPTSSAASLARTTDEEQRIDNLQAPASRPSRPPGGQTLRWHEAKTGPVRALIHDRTSDPGRADDRVDRVRRQFWDLIDASVSGSPTAGVLVAAHGRGRAF